MLLGLALAASPFVIETTGLVMAVSIAVGVLLMVLTIPKGKIEARYGKWDAYIK